jgi:hypothetical protein
MITRNVLTFVALAGGIALFACSSDDASEKFGSSDSFCAAKAEAECTHLAAACGASADACKSKRTTVCTDGAKASAAQGRNYKSSAAQDCIDKVNSVYEGKGIGLTATKELEVTTTCDRVFGGTKAEKEACGATFECSGSLICDGVCIAQETVSKGGGCANAGQVCETGTYCQASGGTGKRFCVEKNTLDETCGADAPCVESLRCVNRCIAKVTVGNPCDKDEECADEAPYCDLTTMPRKCRPKYQAGTAICKDFGSTI